MRCAYCLTNLDPALTAAGITMHPDCADNDAIIGERLRKAMALLVAELGAQPIDPPTEGDPL